MTTSNRAREALAKTFAGVVHNQDDGTLTATMVLDALHAVGMTIIEGELEQVGWAWGTKLPVGDGALAGLAPSRELVYDTPVYRIVTKEAQG